LNSELEDVTSELLSLIFEHAKAILNGQKGFSIEKSYPSVLMGDALTLHYQLQNPAIILPFDSPSGAFHIEISVDQV
jgi:CheY-specific phosphatase CheX